MAWANKMDREYLRLLVEKDPDKFLQEMMPNPEHDGACIGLDLNHPHHLDLQKEFQDEIRNICQAKGLTAHPALLVQQQDKNLTDGAIKECEANHLAQQQEIAALKATIAQLMKKNKEQDQTIKQLTEQNYRLLQQVKSFEEYNETPERPTGRGPGIL